MVDNSLLHPKVSTNCVCRIPTRQKKTLKQINKSKNEFELGKFSWQNSNFEEALNNVVSVVASIE